jgi:hypothetical protein
LDVAATATPVVAPYDKLLSTMTCAVGSRAAMVVCLSLHRWVKSFTVELTAIGPTGFLRRIPPIHAVFRLAEYAFIGSAAGSYTDHRRLKDLA